MDQFKLDLNSLLLAYESAVLEHFELASSPFEGQNEWQANSAKARVERIRHRILNFHEKWPNYDEDRRQLLMEAKR